jgi:hypothetical protein
LCLNRPDQQEDESRRSKKVLLHAIARPLSQKSL